MTAVHTEIGRNKIWERPRHIRDSGKPEFIPAELPTEDDLPYEDDEPMETPRHKDQMNLLIDSLKAYWNESRRYYIGGNMFLHFRVNTEKKFGGPDVFLVTDVENRERKSWVVWQEGMRYPDLIIELLSPKTRKTDKGEKKEIYEQTFRTSEYYVYDPFGNEFEGYRLSGGRYKTVKPDKEKKIYSPVTGLWLIVKDSRLRWMTEERHILPSHEELSKLEKQRADQAEKHMTMEKLRAEQAENRAERLAAKLRELGISPEMI